MFLEFDVERHRYHFSFSVSSFSPETKLLEKELLLVKSTSLNRNYLSHIFKLHIFIGGLKTWIYLLSH
jgi:hypothetical protein